MGMTRVYATIRHSDFASDLSAECDDLVAWSNDLLRLTFSQMDVSATLLFC